MRILNVIHNISPPFQTDNLKKVVKVVIHNQNCLKTVIKEPSWGIIIQERTEKLKQSQSINGVLTKNIATHAKPILSKLIEP